MGLDMYLRAKRYYWHDDTKPVVAEVPEGFEVKEIIVEAAYWRKANEIHSWFVTNVQNGEDDCGNYHVERSQLQELLKICVMVDMDHAKAPGLLPTQGGFFFGSTEYDKWYFDGVKETVATLTKVLKAFPEGDISWEFEYHSSW
jgi:hypothetical protein